MSFKIQPSIWRQHARQQQGHDRIALARAIAARSEPRLIELEPEPRRQARLGTRFMEIPRQRGEGRVPFTEAELTAMRGGLTVEEYRLKNTGGSSSASSGSSASC